MTSSKLFTLLIAGSLAALSTLSAVGCAAPTLEEEEEEMGESENHVLAGTRYTPAQIATYLRGAGFAENTIGKMVCTAKYESSYYSKATNRNKNGSIDRGLFQINSIHVGGTRGCPSSGEALFNPETNAACALAIFKSQGIRAWYGYRKHKSECDRTRAPGSAAVPAGEDDDATDIPLPTPRPTDLGGTADAGAGANANEGEATIDPNDDYELGGGCWSATKQDMMAPLSCVEQTGSNVWFQCKDGKWYRGGDDVQGAYGYCNGAYPLGQ